MVAGKPTDASGPPFGKVTDVRLVPCAWSVCRCVHDERSRMPVRVDTLRRSMSLMDGVSPRISFVMVMTMSAVGWPM